MPAQTTTVTANEINVGAILLWASGTGAVVESLRIRGIKTERFISGPDYVPIPVDYITAFVLDLARLNDGSYRGSISVKPEQVLTVLA